MERNKNTAAAADKNEKGQASKKIRLNKAQLICIAAAFATAFLSVLSKKADILSGDGISIERTEPGTADKVYELEVEGISQKAETINVRVSGREYSEEEAVGQFERIMEELPEYIIGENESLENITGDMTLPKRLEGFGGIRLSWNSEDSEVIANNGSVNNSELKEPKRINLYLTLNTGSSSEKFCIPVTVYPTENISAEQLTANLEKLIKEADSEQITSDRLILPESVNGYRLSYKTKKNRSCIGIIAIGIIAAFVIGLKPKQEIRKAEKKRETMLLLDYSEVVSKLAVYIGAGLAVRNAWIKISEDYQKKLSAGQIEIRPVYEEMLLTAAELKNGTAETKAYTDFAKRCPQKCYIKLISLLEQEIKTGDAGVRTAMELEIRDAFEQRKNVARRLGEEAGTKLILPLMLSLAEVMLIAAVPAMLALA